MWEYSRLSRFTIILKMTIHHDQLIVPSLITGFAEGNTFLITKFQIYLALLKSTPSFFFFFFFVTLNSTYTWFIQRKKKHKAAQMVSSCSCCSHIPHFFEKLCHSCDRCLCKAPKNALNEKHNLALTLVKPWHLVQLNKALSPTRPPPHTSTSRAGWINKAASKEPSAHANRAWEGRGRRTGRRGRRGRGLQCNDWIRREEGCVSGTVINGLIMYLAVLAVVKRVGVGVAEGKGESRWQRVTAG